MVKEKLSTVVLIVLAGLVFAQARNTQSAQADGQQPAAPARSSKVDFVRDIQPIFKRACYSCHGPEIQTSGLRLDSKESTMAGGRNGMVIKRGAASESPLYNRVAGLAGLERMPFRGTPLTSEEIALIKAWIDQGAEWPDEGTPLQNTIKKHWAWVPPRRPAVPEAGNSRWVRNPIDRFVLTRLEKEGVGPSPEADRVTLLRRLSLDLLGLPPTVEEVDRFLSDKSKDAYEKQVERLLASPHYGERWARIWLDAARYADSDGYEKDKSRQVWFYRDWVIRALNQDLPYDQFIVDQIAGDLLPGATQDQIVATGFLRNSMINEEGGIEPEQFRMEAMFDRMDTIGKGVLGITIQCAQCHNHKFDPLTQGEYYRMFAFINDSYEANIAVYTPEEQMKQAETSRKIAEIEAELQHQNPDWPARLSRWEETVKNDQPDWTIIRPVVEDISTGGQKYLPLEDGSLLAQGYAPTRHTVKLSARTQIQNVTAFRLELLNDANLPLGGPGRSINGTCALTEFEVEAAPADEPNKVTKIKFAKATSDVSVPEVELGPIFDDKSKRRRVVGPVEFAIDGKDETAWGIDVGPGLRNQPRKAVFVTDRPITNPSGTIFTFHLKQNHGGWNSDDNQNNNLGRFRLSITGASDATADPLPQGVRETLSIPTDQRTSAQLHALFSYWRTTVPEWKQANDKIAELWREYPEGSSQLVLKRLEQPRETHILARGDFLKPGKVVSPGVPAFLHPLPAGSLPNRLTFARWLVDPGSPTTARSIVNRMWQAYFGTGIVATPEDFGRQGDAPSHRELLDWLAVEFMEKGWSLKSLHRLVVTSATYRQTSNVTRELYQRDPYNRLLARGARFRVDAEAVRDIQLAASGLLNPKLGGSSVFPPAPDFLFVPPASFGPKNWNVATGPDRYRRAIYTFRFRSVPYPMLQAFDAPNGNVSCIRRARSNTPLQALTTLNEPLSMEAARALAMLVLKDGGATDNQRLVYAFRRCLARTPAPEETDELLRLLNKQKQRFTDGELNPWNVAANDPDKPMPLPKGTTMEQLAAWTAVSRVLLNLDETITRE